MWFKICEFISPKNREKIIIYDFSSSSPLFCDFLSSMPNVVWSGESGPWNRTKARIVFEFWCGKLKWNLWKHLSGVSWTVLISPHIKFYENCVEFAIGAAFVNHKNRERFERSFYRKVEKQIFKWSTQWCSTFVQRNFCLWIKFVFFCSEKEMTMIRATLHHQSSFGKALNLRENINEDSRNKQRQERASNLL